MSFDPFKNLMSAQGATGKPVTQRESKRKHDKNAPAKNAAFKEKVVALGELKQKVQSQTDKVTAAKLSTMRTRADETARKHSQQQEEIKHFENLGYKVKAKEIKRDPMAFNEDIEAAEKHIAKTKEKLQQAISGIAPEAGQRMVSALSHFVNTNNIQKEDFAPILADLKQQETYSAADFKKLAQINQAVINAKIDAPQVQEALASGRKFGLTEDTLEVLADSKVNLIQSTAQEKVVEEVVVSEELETDKETAVLQEAVTESEPTATTPQETKKPLLGGLLNNIKTTLSENTSKLTALASRLKPSKAIPENKISNSEQVDNIIQLDEASHEIVLEEPQKISKVNLDSMLRGVNPKIHSISMEDGNTVISIHMSEDLLKAAMQTHDDKESYMNEHPTSVETTGEKLAEVDAQLQEKLHNNNFERSDKASQLVATHQREEPTISDDSSIDIDHEKNRVEPTINLNEITR